MAKPIVYLAFANDQDAYLSLLKEEGRQLKTILSALHDKQAVEVHRDESANVEDLLNSFNRFDGRLAVFHYGGHAGGTGLRLEEGDAQAEGLAKLLAQQKNLQLIFLNGCSTLPQVDRLMALGVKAVIATSVSIEDPKAVDFSASFYQALATKRCIKDAFDYAVAALQTKYAGTVAPAVLAFRDFVMTEDAKTDEMPWGLYINEDQKEILEWRLPDAPIQPILSNPLTNYKPNDYLPKILAAMARYDQSLQEIIEDVNAGKTDKRKVLPTIVEYLPWTIAAQLQKLISRSESTSNLGIERLQQTIQTYVIASQVLLYILISRLWEEQHQATEKVAVPAVAELLSLDERGARFYDYVATFARIGALFREKNWHPFVDEFNDLFDALEKKERFYQSYMLLESIRDQLASDSLDAGAAPQYCEEAENSLTIFIGTISFLIKYKMVAVRDIMVTSTRYQEVKYQHKLGSLNAAGSDYLTLDRKPRSFQNHVESSSILLLDDLEKEEINRWLSLSPFIMDNNAFRDKSKDALDIYIFSHVEKGNYVYKNVNLQFQKMEQHNAYTISTAYEEKIEVKSKDTIGWEDDEASYKVDQPYEVLKTQFDKLKADLTNS